MSMTVLIAVANSALVSYIGMSNLRASEGAAQTNGVVDCHTIKVMLRLGHAPVEAGVSDGIFRMVSRNRFQAEATELAVV